MTEGGSDIDGSMAPLWGATVDETEELHELGIQQMHTPLESSTPRKPHAETAVVFVTITPLTSNCEARELEYSNHDDTLATWSRTIRDSESKGPVLLAEVPG